MNKQELIKEIKKHAIYHCGEKECYKEGCTQVVDLGVVLGLVKQLDEPEKVKVPQFVADWIEKYKTELSLREAMSQAHVSIEVNDWLIELDSSGAFSNQDIFARAWFDGYEVEEEKRYFVKMKGIDINFNFLNRHRNENYWIFSNKDKNTLYQTHHTRKELEEAGFGWVFDCPGIEIEEVE